MSMERLLNHMNASGRSAAAAAAGSAAEPTTLPLGRGETVLIVESDRERLLQDEEKLAALGLTLGMTFEPDLLEAPKEDAGAQQLQ